MGEMGELCNELKKLERDDDYIMPPYPTCQNKIINGRRVVVLCGFKFCLADRDL